MTTTLVAKKVSKNFETPSGIVRALVDIDLEVDSGQLLAVMGPSGSGKSTLLQILGCLAPPTTGEVSVEGARLPIPNTRAGARFRSRSLGFVFQDYGLIEDDTATENVEVPIRYGRPSVSRRERKARSSSLLDTYGLQHRARTKVSLLSGGERQRVAIARAMANYPALVLADEPTGALDTANAAKVMAQFRAITDAGHAAVVVTHDDLVASLCDSRVVLRDGQIVERS